MSISLAHRWPDLVKAVVVENTFLSVGAMVDKLMPFAKSIKGLILRINWDSDNKIQKVKQPIMFISGQYVCMRSLVLFALKISALCCSYSFLCVQVIPMSSCRQNT